MPGGLIECPRCGHRVSRDAAACPECGHPIRRSAFRAVDETLGSCLTCAGTIFAIVVLIALASWLFGC